MRQSVLVLGAHPDDGEIGVGGTIASYTKRGHRVVLVTLSVPAGQDDASEHHSGRRRGEGDRAAAMLGAELLNLGLPREGIQPNARLVTRFDRILADVQPTAIFTHWLGDSHPEHVAATRAMLAAARRNLCSVYMYEVTLPGGISTESFRPQKYVDITDTIDCKLASLECHETQLQRLGPGWMEAIRGRAALRGFQIGCRYAEAFEVVKDVATIPDLRQA